MASNSPPSRSDRETLIASALRHIATNATDDFWAWDKVCSMAEGPSPEAAWDVVSELVRRSDDGQLGRIGVGPIENMVNAHGGALVEWIEGESRRDPRFKFALGAIWLTTGRLPADVESRIVAASGGRIVLLAPRASSEA